MSERREGPMKCLNVQSHSFATLSVCTLVSVASLPAAHFKEMLENLLASFKLNQRLTVLGV